MISAPWSQNYIILTLKTKKRMPISVQRTSWTSLLNEKHWENKKLQHFFVPQKWKFVSFLTECCHQYNHVLEWCQKRTKNATTKHQETISQKISKFQHLLWKTKIDSKLEIIILISRVKSILDWILKGWKMC